MYHFL